MSFFLLEFGTVFFCFLFVMLSYSIIGRVCYISVLLQRKYKKKNTCKNKEHVKMLTIVLETNEYKVQIAGFVKTC